MYVLQMLKADWRYYCYILAGKGAHTECNIHTVPEDVHK